MRQKDRSSGTNKDGTIYHRIPSNPAGVAQLVEHQLAKLDVASSNLVSRSKIENWGVA